MRTKDKLKNYEQANLMLEQSYLKSKGLIKETNIVTKNEILKEDILELKQMAKQLYSFLKKKGFPVTLSTNIKKPLRPENPKGGSITAKKSSIQSDNNVGTVQIVVQEGQDEIAQVLVTPADVARVIVGGGNDWSHKASQKFGDDWSSWYKNSEILKYVNNLGNELLKEIKGKYPNMSYKFEQKDWFYILYFGYAQTAKGGKVNPKQRNNNPKPNNQQNT
jgi:hypothetical protein